MVKAIITAEKIPMTETSAIDLSAGCLANTNTPIPRIVVNKDRRTEVLWMANTPDPNWFSCLSPFVIKIQ